MLHNTCMSLEVFMMMDSTDFEEHVLLNALEDREDDDNLTKEQPLTNKTLSRMSTSTATTVMTDEEDIDSFFFDEGVEMVVDDDAKPPALILEDEPMKVPKVQKERKRS